MTKTDDAIAILGGTGDQGLGLALRFAKAGRKVVIGSRKAEKAYSELMDRLSREIFVDIRTGLVPEE